MPGGKPKAQNVQLVFQGGGAKLSALLAAAGAVQEMQTEGLINVTGVSGTSAGAIAAAILATGLPVGDFRNRLRDRGERYLSYINADVGRLRIGFAFARGQPFLSEAGFRKVLWDLFGHDKGRIESFGQLKIPLTVVASDIRNGQRVTYSNATGSTPLIDALIDSAALPLVFRGGASGQHIVDGGLCENLPVAVMEDEAKNGKVVAISFARMAVPETPSNTLSMMMALLNTAMSNSVNRAVASLPAGRVLYLRSDIDLLDFRRALTEGLATALWNNHAYETRRWLEKVLDDDNQPATQAIVTASPLPFGPVDVMQRLSRVYEAQHHPIAVQLHSISLQVTAFCLLDRKDPRASRPDRVQEMLYFSPLTEPLSCYRLALSSNGTGAVEGLTDWRVTDRLNDEVDIIPIPIMVPEAWSRQASESARGVLLFFATPLRPKDDRAPYRIVQQDDNQHAMIPLRDNGFDHLSLTSSRGDVEVSDLVIELPAAYKSVQLASMPGGLPGRPMTPLELDKYGPPETGFHLKGWRGEGLKRDQRFGVVLTMPSP
jgi:predicted acylesterase/phospholipase RssA